MQTEATKNGHTAALQTDNMIGTERQEFLAQVKNAIADRKKKHIFFFVGIGGIGKTRLLKEIGKTINKQQGVRWSDIVDLYQSEMHSNSDIEQKLAEKLDPDNDYFQPYHELRQTFETDRYAGFGGSLLEKKRQELTQQFVECFNELSKDFRLVLTFDTLELVQYESEDIQELCEVQDENTSVKSWLLSQVPHFENTVTIFSGRPHRQLQVEFEDKFNQAGCHYIGRYVDKLSEQDARTFLGELATRCAALKDVDEQLFGKIFSGSENGRPIYLSLAADLAREGEGPELSELFDDSQTLRRKIAYRLLDDLPLQHSTIIKHLAYARQGLDIPLLLHLENKISQKRAEDLFEEMVEYTFIKHAESSTHPAGQLFLHDEVYDILDQERLRAIDDETQPQFQKICDYYQKLQQKLAVQLTFLQTGENSHKKKERREKQRELENVKAKQLYYELQLKSLQAYWCLYNRWAEEAIKSHQTGFDMRLQDVVLSFFRYVRQGYAWQQKNQKDHTRYNALHEVVATHEDAFTRNSAVLWVRRYNARGEFEKAKRVANKIKDSRKKVFNWKQNNDRLYQGALLTALGEAMYFTNSAQEDTLKILQPVIELLQASEQFTRPDNDESWRRARILGLANNNIGFTFRLGNRFSTAIPYYHKAIAFYRQVDVLSEMASTITNLAYVYAQLGAIDEAEALAEDAVAIWQRLGQPYNLALSMNAWGLICLLADQPHRAKAFCMQADDLFSNLVTGGGHASELRGRGLSQLALGETWRRLANLHFLQVYDEDEAIAFLMNGRNCLQTAIDIFQEADPHQMMSSYAELGRLYRDWALVLLRSGKKQDAQERKYQAQDFLEKARNLAQERNTAHVVADISQDLVALHWATGQHGLAREELKKAEAAIDNRFRPQAGKGFEDIPEPLDSFWQLLGKIYFLQAQMSFSSAPPLTETLHGDQKMAYIHEGVLYFVQAAACFEKYARVVPFSHQSPKMKQTKIAIYHQLKAHKASRLREILNLIKETAVQYRVSEQLDAMIQYLERTLGVYS